MRFRLQQVTRGLWQERFLFCTQPEAGNRWQCRRIRRGQLDRELRQLDLDYRDTHELFSKLRFAVRHFGLANGYVEYDLDSDQRGPVGFEGDPRFDRP